MEFISDLCKHGCAVTFNVKKLQYMFAASSVDPSPILTAGLLFWVMEVGEDTDKYENKVRDKYEIKDKDKYEIKDKDKYEIKDKDEYDTGLNHLPILTAGQLFWVMEVM